MPKIDSTAIDEFNHWLKLPEGRVLEFKTAKNSFSIDKDLPDYCAAISNEGGGKLILGVDPYGKVVGTSAFQGTLNKLSHDLFTKIKIRVDVEELLHPEGRVLIFHIPPRPRGRPIRSTGAYTYPMRAGESLTEMDDITLRTIFNETELDFSHVIVEELSLADLDQKALDNFKKAGLVERSGQGMDDIFGSTIKEGKGMPDLSESDAFSVRLKIPAKVKDKEFILFLERITKDKEIILSFEEIYELEKIREHQMVSDSEFKKKFLDIGIIEKIGRTRGAKYILSHKYYTHEGRIGTYTRLTGLSRDQKKELILNHLRKNEKGFITDFFDVFPDLKQPDINNLLQELKRDEKVIHTGTKRSGYWTLK